MSPPVPLFSSRFFSRSGPTGRRSCSPASSSSSEDTPLGIEANTRHRRLCILDGAPELCAADLRARSRNHRFPRDESPVHPRRALWVKWNQWSRVPWRHDTHQVRRSGSVRRRNVRDPRLPGGSPERHTRFSRLLASARSTRAGARSRSTYCATRATQFPQLALEILDLSGNRDIGSVPSAVAFLRAVPSLKEIFLQETGVHVTILSAAPNKKVVFHLSFASLDASWHWFSWQISRARVEWHRYPYDL